jgi:MtN3 and saliva related transmembrane protein
VNWPLLTGIAAALCTTLAFVPQLFKIEKQRSTELSSAMLFIYLGGQVLWLSYGVMLRSIPLIAANATSTVLVYAVSARKAAAARRLARRPGRLRIAIDLGGTVADAPGCVDAIRALASQHDVSIANADADASRAIEADYLVDDRPRQLERFTGHRLLFSAPHNAGDTRYIRIDSWTGVREFFARLGHSSPS